MVGIKAVTMTGIAFVLGGVGALLGSVVLLGGDPFAIEAMLPAAGQVNLVQALSVAVLLVVAWGFFEWRMINP